MTMTAGDRDLDRIPGKVADLIDVHHIPAAESILANLIANGMLNAATPQQRCRVYLEWGWIHGTTQRYETAREAFAAAIGIAEGLPRKNLLCEALREAGVVARYEGDFGSADSLLVRSERAARDEGNDLELGQALFLRATVAHHRGAFVKASALLRQATAAAGRCPPGQKRAQLRAGISREQAVSARVADDPGPASLAHFHLAFGLIQAGEVPEALSHAVASFTLNEANGRRLQDPAERRSFYRQHSDTYGLALHCAARAGDGRAALTVALAGRAEALAAFVRAGAHLVPGLHGLADDIALPPPPR
jgi:tetratricopeptide (TPR) repeat protein